MSKLPKNFPEYSIMYKTLNKKIQDLKYKKTQTQDKSIINEIQSNIEKYQKEIDRIKSIFPENFFDKDS
jgi:peptidoglycan hydrolase CwlO-like protein